MKHVVPNFKCHLTWLLHPYFPAIPHIIKFVRLTWNELEIQCLDSADTFLWSEPTKDRLVLHFEPSLVTIYLFYWLNCRCDVLKPFCHLCKQLYTSHKNPSWHISVLNIMLVLHMIIFLALPKFLKNCSLCNFSLKWHFFLSNISDFLFKNN